MNYYLDTEFHEYHLQPSFLGIKIGKAIPTIDLISIDAEGSEWFVIKNMKSRPTVISIETHGGMYVNPYLGDLLNWMLENDYILWYKDGSDSVFVLRNTIPILFFDKINLIKSNLLIILKSKKKRLSKNIKKLFA